MPETELPETEAEAALDEGGATMMETCGPAGGGGMGETQGYDLDENSGENRLNPAAATCGYDD